MKFVKHQAKFVEAVQVGFFYQEVESHSTLFAPKVTKNFPCSMKDTGDTVRKLSRLNTWRKSSRQ